MTTIRKGALIALALAGFTGCVLASDINVNNAQSKKVNLDDNKTYQTVSAKVVYDLSSGDSAKIKKHLIKSINAVSDYYKSQNKAFDAIVVISGDAYKFFVEDLKDSPYANDTEVQKLQAELKPLLAELHTDKHIVYNMCESGMKARGIKKDTLYKFVNADAMKSVYLINAQNKGYAYMPIH